jgi:hypothetical protein
VRNGQSLLSLADADSLQLYACSMAGCSPAAVVTWRARLLASSASDPPPGQPHSTPLAADGHGRPPTAMAVLWPCSASHVSAYFSLFQLILSQNTIESAETSRLFHQPNQPFTLKVFGHGIREMGYI